jgi:subtilisin family serine protease
MYNSIKKLAVLVTVFCLLAVAVMGHYMPMLPRPQDSPGSDDGSSALNPVDTFGDGSVKDAAMVEPITEPATNQVHFIAAAAVVSPYAETKVSPREIAVGDKRYPVRTYKALAIPNDPTATQWWTTNTGLPKNWDYNNGAGQTIAIIDSGFALSHEELAGRWLTRAGETGTSDREAASDLNCTDQAIALNQSCNNIDDDQDGINDNESGPTSEQNPSAKNCTAQALPISKSCNRLDDDSNGFVDDVNGWDFFSGDASVKAGQLYPAGGAVSHGTSVAGVAAASGNNGKGIAGVNWNSKILPLQALSDNGEGDTLTVARAIRYAADNDVDVINLSLGSEFEDSYLRDAIRYAIEKGSVVVAAAGNDGCDCISYPARYPEVVAVGAQGPDGNVTSFSSFGPNLDIVAPGASMILPAWSAARPTDRYTSGMAGTSFSAPYVSGLLASARSRQPNASWGQIISIMHQTADHRAQTMAAPRSDQIGYGFARADAFAARISDPFSQALRYSLTTAAPDTLAIGNIVDCEQVVFPSAKLYEVRQAGTVYFTTSELAIYVQKQAGATITEKSYVCSGLPTDRITTLSRIIESNRELANAPPKH